MSSQQRKGPERLPTAAPQNAVAPAHELGQPVSNDAAQDGLARDAGDGLRAAALDLLDHARWALEVTAPVDTDRWVRVLGASHLPAERIAGLVGRLEDRQWAAAEVDRVVAGWSGAAGPEAREALGAALSAARAAVVDGAPAGDGWQAGERRWDAAGVDANSRAEALIAAIGGSDGGALVAACRTLALSISFEEDEEESLLADYTAEERG